MTEAEISIAVKQDAWQAAEAVLGERIQQFVEHLMEGSVK